MIELAIELYDADWALVDTIAQPVRSCRTELRLYGGCARASLELASAWREEIATVGQGVVVKSGGSPVFVGRVASADPSYDSASHRLEVDGWWKRLDEIKLVDDPINDRIAFGNNEDSDHTDILTVAELVDWIADEYLGGIVTGTDISHAAASCKFQDFAIYASDKLTRVLETLAAMDDCVCGVDAYRRFYWKPRATVSATLGLEVRAAEAPPAGWKASGIAYAVGGRFSYDRAGPNTLHIASRDIDYGPGVRTYSYVSDTVPGRRIASYYAPQVRSGVGARRLARGLFRRFANRNLKIEDVECIVGTRRLEPHLGRIDVYDGEVLAASDLAGTIAVNWTDPFRVAVTLGESKPDPGGGNPVNDPFEPSLGSSPPDDPQIDTGDGTSDPDDYPIPSQEIDEDDGFDGDGDDLHTNEDRAVPADPPGAGVDGVDYGTDRKDDTNGSGGGTGGAGRQVYKAKITGGTAGAYSLQVLSSSGTVLATKTNVVAWPEPAAPYEEDDEVVVFYPVDAPTQPIIIGTGGAASSVTIVEKLGSDKLGFAQTG